MPNIDHILCKLGLHQHSQWDITETQLEPITGHELLDSIEDDLVIETRTRYCQRCQRGQIKQVLKW
jgi:hypothetical protein